jgi:hypothetical protein
MARDYIPQNASSFNLYMMTLLDYVESKLTSWNHVPAERVKDLRNKYNLFADAYQQTIGPKTSTQVHARNETQTNCTKALRLFVNQYLRFDPVTNADRIAIGVPNRDSVRTERKEVKEAINFEIRLRNIRELRVHFQQAGVNNKAKPTGYDGAVVVWTISETMPTSPTEFKYHGMASRTPYTINFNEEDRGKTAWVALAWQNRRGIRGKWSAFKNAVIP